MIFAGIISVCLVVFALIYAVTKNKKPLKRAFLSMLSGVLSLVILNILGAYWDIGLNITPFSLIASACGGVPMVAAMLLINTMLL